MQGGWRLAEVIGALSVASEEGKGHADGQALRTCTLAVELAERMGLPSADVEATFWVSLLRFVGCTATATDMAAALGDDRLVSAAFATADPRALAAVLESYLRPPDRAPTLTGLATRRSPSAGRRRSCIAGAGHRCRTARAVAPARAVARGARFGRRPHTSRRT
jgi:hypothetical protein